MTEIVTPQEVSRITPVSNPKFVYGYRNPRVEASTARINWKKINPDAASKTGTYYNSETCNMIFNYKRNTSEAINLNEAYIQVTARWYDTATNLTQDSQEIPNLGVWQMTDARLDINDETIEDIRSNASHVLHTNLLSMMSKDEYMKNDDINLLSGTFITPFQTAVTITTGTPSAESIAKAATTVGKLAVATSGYTQRLPLKYMFRSCNSDTVYNNIDNLQIELVFPIESFSYYLKANNQNPVCHVYITKAALYIPTYEMTASQQQSSAAKMKEGAVEYMSFIQRRCTNKDYTENTAIKISGVKNLKRVWMGFSAYDVAATNSNRYQYIPNAATSLDLNMTYGSFALPSSGGKLNLWTSTDHISSPLRELWEKTILYDESKDSPPYNAWEGEKTMFLIRVPTSSCMDEMNISAPQDLEIELTGAATKTLKLFEDIQVCYALKVGQRAEKVL